MIKSPRSEQNQSVAELSSTPGSLAASQDSEPLWRAEEIGSDVNQTDILDAGMKYVNIRKSRTTQWATIFPMTDAGYGIILE